MQLTENKSGRFRDIYNVTNFGYGIDRIQFLLFYIFYLVLNCQDFINFSRLFEEGKNLHREPMTRLIPSAIYVGTSSAEQIGAWIGRFPIPHCDVTYQEVQGRMLRANVFPDAELGGGGGGRRRGTGGGGGGGGGAVEGWGWGVESVGGGFVEDELFQ